MAAAADALMSLAPLVAAQGLSDYSQFNPCEVPKGSRAVQAMDGFVRPFSDDETACDVLRAIESNIPLQISGGRLSAETSNLRKRPFEDFLTGMTEPFKLLILEFEGTKHRRAFLTSPRMVPRFSMPQHVRMDKTIQIDGRPHPALCIYSGSLFRYADDASPLDQFLDQTATYLAKYLIWLRTRQLFGPSAFGDRRFVFKRRPNEPVSEIETLLSPNVYWDGYWPGPSAPSGPAQHLATIKRRDECWCWSGKPYGECCRPREHEALRLAGKR